MSSQRTLLLQDLDAPPRASLSPLTPSHVTVTSLLSQNLYSCLPTISHPILKKNDNSMPPKEMPDLKGASKMPGSATDISNASLEDQVMLIVARLMEGGQDDEDTCRTLDSLTKILSDESNNILPVQQASKPLHELIDADSFDTLLGFLDMREGATVRGHATLTVSAFLKASEQKGTEYLTVFFKSRVSKGTYDDFIVAFSVAACIFPIVPSISADLFLSDGFVNGLGPLMRRKWKSKKVEQACLEMLNAACMNAACCEAIRKYCTEWLEEIVAGQAQNVGDTTESRQVGGSDESQQQRAHSKIVRNLAAVILAKLQVSQ
jgi:protein unc-45